MLGTCVDNGVDQLLPDNQGKLLLVDHMLEESGVLQKKKAEHLRVVAPCMKKLCKFYLQFLPRSSADTPRFFTLLCELTRLVSLLDTSFPQHKVMPCFEAFLANTPKPTVKAGNQELRKIKFLIAGYANNQ